ncbi:hypothetical protein ACO2FA_13400 [Staphylococcus warneri]
MERKFNHLQRRNYLVCKRKELEEYFFEGKTGRIQTANLSTLRQKHNR